MTLVADSDKVTLEYVPRSHLAQFWPLAAPMIEQARRRYDRDYGLADVLKALEAGRALLWLVNVDGQPVAAMTTSEEIYPRRKSILIELLGGKGVSEWASAAIAELASVARAAGYDAIETRGRPGWAKLAKQNNFRVKHVAFEMELS